MDVLQQAQGLADKILALTKALVLTGAEEQEESDIEAYAKMVEEREPLIKELMELRPKIDDAAKETVEFAAIVDTIDAITALDDEHHEFMENVREAVQGALRKVKHGQKVHEGYHAQPPDTTSHRFDTKH